MKHAKAELVLEDGSRFPCTSFGYPKSIAGEVVFNTGMTGYPESFTDPSYAGQILCLTYPLIGNYGVPPKAKDRHSGLLQHFESDRIHLQGLIVSEYSEQASHWDAALTLEKWLRQEKVPAVYGLDTRALTKKLREKGVMLGKIVVNGRAAKPFDPNTFNIVADVSVKKPMLYGTSAARKTIALIDCGAKYNIIRSLLARGVSVLRVPWDYDLLNGKHDFDGVMISNGPGDPKQCRETIAHIAALLEKEIPTFGICLGNQLLALAAGGDTYKLKYGHRGQNQPCTLQGTQRCFITSQNHGFAVDVHSLSDDWEPLFTNANDGTNEGIKHKRKPFFSAQFHPEATPGPVDTGFLFDEFLKKVYGSRRGKP